MDTRLYQEKKHRLDTIFASFNNRDKPIIIFFIHFYPRTKSRKSNCTTPGVGVGVSKKFNVKVFYVMGKALSGELSCPCDRSCCVNNTISVMSFIKGDLIQLVSLFSKVIE